MPCPDGGTGRRDGLKTRCQRWHVGSIPTPGTIVIEGPYQGGLWYGRFLRGRLASAMPMGHTPGTLDAPRPPSSKATASEGHDMPLPPSPSHGQDQVSRASLARIPALVVARLGVDVPYVAAVRRTTEQIIYRIERGHHRVVHVVVAVLAVTP